MIRLRYRSLIARLLKVEGIVLYPWVFFAKTEAGVSRQTLLHEMVHVRQVREHGWMGFYGKYLREYARNLAKYKNHYEAYRRISFEDEAYRMQSTLVLTAREQEEILRQKKS